MDFWVFVAAAGAGCLAKRMQSSSLYKDGLSKLTYEASSSGDHKLNKHPASGVTRRRIIDKDASKNRGNVLDQEIFDIPHSNFGSVVDWGPPSLTDDQTNAKDLGECNGSSVTGLPADLPVEQTETVNHSMINGDSNDCDGSETCLAEPLVGKMASFYCCSKHGRPLRSTFLHAQLLKPQSSLESCLLAQLYNNHAEMMDMSCNPPRSSIYLNVREPPIADGSNAFCESSIGQAGAHVKKTHIKVNPERSRVVLGVPPLRKVRASKLTKEVQHMGGKGKDLVTPCRMTFGKSILPQNGTGTTMLCIGISLGIIFSLVSNKKEADKLKDLLKQTENLVQDLQEELEMRDSLTVKELASENYESLDTHNNSIHGTGTSIISPDRCVENLTKSNGNTTYTDADGNHPDSMARIEAELEAELERLGLDLKASNLGRRLSDAGIDQDFDVDFAEDEFRAERDFTLKDANCQDASGTSSPRSINYAVSPKELSLRLHEVIQSRLEERIEELELALQNSQRKVQLLESSPTKSQRRSPLTTGYLQPLNPDSSFSKPFMMHHPGEALSTYHESYEELVKFESEEDDSPPGPYELQHRELPENGHSTAQEIDNMCALGYESSDADDDEEKLLIKQIIERTKKGSPVVVNALLSIDKYVE